MANEVFGYGRVLDQYAQYAVLGLHFENDGDGVGCFKDATGRHSVGVTDTSAVYLSSAQAKFGTTSALVTGALDNYFIVDDGIGDFTFTGDFTVQFWFYITSNPTGEKSIFETGAVFISSALRTGVALRINSTGNLIMSKYEESGGALMLDVTSASAVPLNQWNHFALTRSGTTYASYLNGAYMSGTYNASSAVFTLPWSGTGLTVGFGEYDTNVWGGYFDEFWIHKGIAMYTGTGSFTPPTVPFTP